MEDTHRMRKSWFTRPVDWIAEQVEQEKRIRRDREIAAWSEIMGQMSAEIWTSDRQGHQASH